MKTDTIMLVGDTLVAIAGGIVVIMSSIVTALISRRKAKVKLQASTDSYKNLCKQRYMYCNSCHKKVIPRSVGNTWVYHCSYCRRTWKTKW